MTFIDPAPLQRTIAHLLAQLDAISSSGGEPAPEKHEKLARAINVQMKALQEINAHNQRCAAQEDQSEYLDYDELPPPNPEQRTQFIERLMRLYHRLNESGEISQADGDNVSE